MAVDQPAQRGARRVDSGDVETEDETVTCCGTRSEVAAVAARRRAAGGAVGDIVTYVRNRNINYTNVCTFKPVLRLLQGPPTLNLRGTPYLLTLDDIAERAAEAWDGATEVTLQGGIHPDFDGDYYVASSAP